MHGTLYLISSPMKAHNFIFQSLEGVTFYEIVSK
jgi:hypothetical protein